MKFRYTKEWEDEICTMLGLLMLVNDFVYFTLLRACLGAGACFVGIVSFVFFVPSDDDCTMKKLRDSMTFKKISYTKHTQYAICYGLPDEP